MRRYEIFLMEEEVASVYFGREEMLFQLFEDRKNSSETANEILEKQIAFITRPIQSYKLDRIIKRELMHQEHYQYNHLLHKLTLNNGQAELKIYEKYLTLITDGDMETETLFFEILRKIDACFLAIDYNNKRYGWLKPIREYIGDTRKRIVVL